MSKTAYENTALRQYVATVGKYLEKEMGKGVWELYHYDDMMKGYRLTDRAYPKDIIVDIETRIGYDGKHTLLGWIIMDGHATMARYSDIDEFKRDIIKHYHRLPKNDGEYHLEFDGTVYRDLDESLIAQWCQIPSKGGLDMGQLRNTALNWGVKNAFDCNLKRKDIKAALLELVA